MRITGLRGLLVAGLAVVSMAAGERDARLANAAKEGNWAAIPALLKQGADVNGAQADGTTALHWAAYWDNVAVADQLMRLGAKATTQNDLGASPLWAASENGSARMVTRLLEAGADANVTLISGETPLLTASRSGNAEVVKALLAKGANVNAKESEYDQTPLMWAVAEKHPAVTEALLAKGADVNARARSYVSTVKFTPEQGSKNVFDIQQGGYTALLFAARVGDLESAKLLLAKGANVNDIAPWGTSALVVASHSGHTELAQYLIEKGADPNLAAAGYTALHIAIVRRDQKLVTSLLAARADPNAIVKAGSPSRRQSGDVSVYVAFVGASPLWLAARYSEPEMMKAIVAKGADPKYAPSLDYWTQGNGYEDVHVAEGPTTVLMSAAGLGYKLLGWDGDPPPDLIAEEGRTYESVKVALELGIDVNAANADGNTALHMAYQRKQEKVVKLLLEHGANPDLKNKRGQTPAESARNGRRGYFG